MYPQLRKKKKLGQSTPRKEMHYTPERETQKICTNSRKGDQNGNGLREHLRTEIGGESAKCGRISFVAPCLNREGKGAT
jgi:hypothetical protein